VTQTTVFEAVGGQPFFDALVEGFYARVEADPTLRPLYPTDLAPATRALALFLGQYWGGPAIYSAEKGHPRLRMRHAPFVIAGRERDAWLSAMLAALDDSDAPPAALRMMTEYFTTASTAMINHDGTKDAGGPTGPGDAANYPR
jgi:hemoglobin